MQDMFFRVINLSITAGILIPVVITLRFLLRKSPKWVTLMLWGFVGVRLICPFSFESNFSLVPRAQVFTPHSASEQTAPESKTVNVDGNIESTKKSHVSAQPAVMTAVPEKRAVKSIDAAEIASMIWITGMAAITLYAAAGYISMKKRVATAVLYRKNIWFSDSVDSPFTFGLIRPKIYIPFGIDGERYKNIILHEQSHIRHLDHIIKPLGFAILTIYWFNPLVWASYILFCRDIELACDERVVKNMDKNSRKSYASTLLECSVENKKVAAYPLSFGATGVKSRVRNIFNYKKTTAVLIVSCVIICTMLSACLMTDPVEQKTVSSGNAAAAEKTNDASILWQYSPWTETKNEGILSYLKFNDDNTGSLEIVEGSRFEIVEPVPEFIYETDGKGNFVLKQKGEAALPEGWGKITMDIQNLDVYNSPLFAMNITLENGEKVTYYSDEFHTTGIEEFAEILPLQEKMYLNQEKTPNEGYIKFEDDMTGTLRLTADSEPIAFAYEVHENGVLTLRQADGSKAALPEKWKKMYFAYGWKFGEQIFSVSLDDGSHISLRPQEYDEAR